MKRYISLIIALCLIFSLCACGKKQEAEVEPVPAAPVEQNSPQPELLPIEAQPSDPQQQESLIQSRFNDWAMDPSFGPWCYAVTDLDRNGRMEVIAASTQGTGHFTTGSLWELSEDFQSLVKYPDNLNESGFWPEVTVNSADCYYDSASNRYYYIFEDNTKADAATYFTTKVSMCLSGGLVSFQTLCSKTEIFNANGGSDVECYDLNGELISQQQFDSYADTFYAGFEKSIYNLSWTMQEGSGAAPVEAVPQPAAPVQTPAPQPVGPQVVITKNPSSEALGIGGKTWFIAHANNASSLTWQLVGTDGRIYSLDEAMAAHPGLKLEALEGDTIAVSNVPLSLNGWGVQAHFQGQGNFAVTTPAYIYVGDFVNAYSSVINKYRNAANVQNKGQYAMDNGISELVSYGGGVGYALKDMDKDGSPELIIGATGGSDKTLYDLYTLVNGSPKQLCCTWARNGYYLRTDNTVLNYGSSSAASSFNALLQMSGKALVGVECVSTYPNNYGGVDHYQQSGAYNYEPGPSSVLISEAQANQKIAEYEAKIFLPPLTKIY